MNEETKKIIKEKFDSLPESIQELILSSNYQDTLIEIGKKYQLNVEQLGLLEQETTLVMMGLTPTKDFEVELTRELNIDKIKGNQIVTEINEKIFLTIRDLLKLMYTPEGEEPSVEETSEEKEPKTSPDKGRQEGFNLESRDELLEKIENPEKTPPIRNDEGSQGPPVSNGTGSILSQKLSGAFSIPKVETDHSLNNMTKGSGEEKTTLPKIDPYRMPIE
jgi:hypothetical protein